MKIIQLTAENVKKLKVVDITPKGDVVQITGKNGSGKTSVLDSIWWALGGEKNIQSVPLRKGAENGRARLDLGDLIVERKWAAIGTTSVIVRNAKDSKPGTPDNKLPKCNSPQAMLDDLLGRLSFDPLEFSREKPKAQFDLLKRIANVGIDLDALDAQNDADFKKRTDVNRDAKARRSQADAFVIPPDTPSKPIDESELLDRIQAAGEHNSMIETRKIAWERAQRDANDQKAEAVRYRESAARQRERYAERVAGLKEQIRKLEMDIVEAQASGETLAVSLDVSAVTALQSAAELEVKINHAEAPLAPINVTDLRTELDKAKGINADVSRRVQRDNVSVEALALESQVAELTKLMARREDEKREAIQNAEMPIPGLGFGAGVVTYNGLPFDQASDAEQLRISLSIAMAANPKLRVIRIKDGSLLDDDSMAIITEMAGEKDWQVWIERVDSSGKIGIVMEDGEVVADNQEADHAV